MGRENRIYYGVGGDAVDGCSYENESMPAFEVTGRTVNHLRRVLPSCVQVSTLAPSARTHRVLKTDSYRAEQGGTYMFVELRLKLTDGNTQPLEEGRAWKRRSAPSTRHVQHLLLIGRESFEKWGVRLP